jgi:hypothetical protein
VLDIVSSILTELQWMARILPTTTQYQWNAVPYDKRDGIGGHVHFARKRSFKARADEVVALDELVRLLTLAGVFNAALCKERIGRAHYGAWADVRIQKHGYEYRTFPTWLSSPWMAYLVLVLSKIAIHEPLMICRLANQSGSMSDNEVRAALIGLLKYFKASDDDVLIAYHAYLKHGFPGRILGDFKQTWGIPSVMPKEAKPIRWYPSMIAPLPEHRSAIFDYLTVGKPITLMQCKVNWIGETFPAGFTSMFHHSSTLRRPGIGEICSNLVCNSALPVILDVLENRKHVVNFYVPVEYPFIGKLYETFNDKFPKMSLQVYRKQSKSFQLFLPKEIRTANQVDLVRDLLLTGLFPVWESHLVTNESFITTWEHMLEHPAEHYKGKEIAVKI